MLEAGRVVSIALDETYVDENGVYKYNGTTALKSGTATSEVLNTLLGKIKSTNNSGVTVTLNGTSNTGLSFSEAALTP